MTIWKPRGPRSPVRPGALASHRGSAATCPSSMTRGYSRDLSYGGLIALSYPLIACVQVPPLRPLIWPTGGPQDHSGVNLPGSGLLVLLLGCVLGLGGRQVLRSRIRLTWSEAILSGLRPSLPKPLLPSPTRKAVAC